MEDRVILAQLEQPVREQPARQVLRGLPVLPVRRERSALREPVSPEQLVLRELLELVLRGQLVLRE